MRLHAGEGVDARVGDPDDGAVKVVAAGEGPAAVGGEEDGVAGLGRGEGAAGCDLQLDHEGGLLQASGAEAAEDREQMFDEGFVGLHGVPLLTSQQLVELGVHRFQALFLCGVTGLYGGDPLLGLRHAGEEIGGAAVQFVMALVALDRRCVRDRLLDLERLGSHLLRAVGDPELGADPEDRDERRAREYHRNVYAFHVEPFKIDPDAFALEARGPGTPTASLSQGRMRCWRSDDRVHGGTIGDTGRGTQRVGGHIKQGG